MQQAFLKKTEFEKIGEYFISLCYKRKKIKKNLKQEICLFLKISNIELILKDFFICQEKKIIITELVLK